MTDPESTDSALMLAYAGGDDTAFDLLYQRYRGPLYRYFRRQLPADQADDCFQALWLRLIDSAVRYRPGGSFNGYLFTLAHNLLMDQHRRTSRQSRWWRRGSGGNGSNAHRGRLWNSEGDREWDRDEAGKAGVADLVDGAPLPEVTLAEQELRQRLLELLEHLPLPQREAWILKQEAGLNVEEIAAVTGTSIEGVRSRLRYATSKLKAGMARYVRA